MFQYAHNLKFDGGAFTVNEQIHQIQQIQQIQQNGFTGALYESMVNRYFLTAIYAKVSRYCIDGSRTAPPMTPPNMHQYVTQIPARLLLVRS